MDKELENRPDLTADGAVGIDAEPETGAVFDDAPQPENMTGGDAGDPTDEIAAALVPADSAADADADFMGAAPEPAEIVFTSDFTVSEVRKRAVKAQKKNLMKSFPKALLYSVLLMLPPLLLFILGMTKTSSSSAAARAIEVIACLVPLVFGGPLFMGILSGSMDISRGRDFKTGTLFFAFKDNWFFKAVGSYLLFTVVSFIINMIFLIPAMVVYALSANLGDGFAAVATQVIVILLSIGGIVIAAQFALRLALMIPLLIEHPEMKVMEAARFSVKAMKGNTWKLFLLFLSYIGWYILSFAIAGAILFGALAAGYVYVMNVFYSGDVYSAYMMLLIGITAAYIAAYVLAMLAASTVIMRPFIGWAAFYDTITGYEPPEEEAPAEAHETTDAPEASDAATDAEQPFDENAVIISEEVAANAPTELESTESPEQLPSPEDENTEDK